MITNGRPEFYLLRTSDGAVAQTLAPGGPTTNATQVSFSPDGSLVAAAWREPAAAIRVWRVADGALVQTLRGDGSERWEDLQFSADGSLLGAAGENLFAQWRLADGAPTVRLSPELRRLGVSAAADKDSSLGAPERKQTA